MKKMYLLLTLVFAFTSCNCQKKAVENNVSKASSPDQNKLSLQYEANTRGFFERISIEDKTVTVSSDRNNPDKGTATTLSDADYNELIKMVKNLNLNDLSSYKDPTQKRFYDGAAIANFKVVVEGKEYKTVDFDHGFPPVEIERLIRKITSFGLKRE